MLFRDHFQSWSDDWVVVVIFTATLIGYLASCLWERAVVPRTFFMKEMALVQRVKLLEKEAQDLNHMDTMSHYSKTQRRIVVLKRELAEIRRRRYLYTLDVNTMLRSPIFFERSSSRARQAPNASAAPTPTNALAAAAAAAAAAARREQRPQGVTTVGADKEGPTSQATAEARGTDSGFAPRVPPGRQTPSISNTTESPTPTYLSWLPAPVAAGLLSGFLYVWYNLPDAVKYALRYHTLVLAWLCWGDRSNLVSFPLCIATQLPLTLLQYIPAALDFVFYGPLGAPGPTLSSVSAMVHHGEAEGATGMGVDKGLPPHCSPLVWALLCLCFVRYGIRVFS